jgi:hypothetical protein
VRPASHRSLETQRPEYQHRLFPSSPARENAQPALSLGVAEVAGAAELLVPVPAARWH